MNTLREVGYNGYAIAEPAYRPDDVSPEEFLSEYVSSRMDKMIGYYQ